MSRPKTTIGLAVGGLTALLIVGTALAHPGGGIVHRVEVLAEALGITTAEVETAKEDGTLKDLLADVTKDDLRTAYETAATEAIDTASADGDITSTQADRLREAVSADRSELDSVDYETLKSLRGAVTVDVTAVYASLLDMTSEEVKAAREDGTLRDLLADVNRVALAAALVDARDAAIDAAEDAGDITAEQAELLRDTGAGFGGSHGYSGYRGGGHGGDRDKNWDHGGRGGGHHGRSGGDCNGSADGRDDKKDSTDTAGDSA